MKFFKKYIAITFLIALFCGCNQKFHISYIEECRDGIEVSYWRNRKDVEYSVVDSCGTHTYESKKVTLNQLKKF